MPVRANTHIDRGHVRLTSAWIERTWSAYMGVTTSLCDPVSKREWIRGQSGEFAIEVNGRVMSVMDFGELDWAEENSVHGACIVMRRMAPRLLLTIRTIAFHEAPGMLRTITVMNAGETPLKIGKATLDSMAIDCDGVKPGTTGSIEWGDLSNPLAMQRFTAIETSNGGLFAGGDIRVEPYVHLAGEGKIELIADIHHTLNVRESFALPRTAICPFFGDCDVAKSTQLPPCFKAIQAYSPPNRDSA